MRSKERVPGELPIIAIAKYMNMIDQLEAIAFRNKK
jgi:hypothetical protein